MFDMFDMFKVLCDDAPLPRGFDCTTSASGRAEENTSLCINLGLVKFETSRKQYSHQSYYGNSNEKRKSLPLSMRNYLTIPGIVLQ